MGFSTVYDVKVRYTVDSRTAQRGVSTLSNETKKLNAEAARTRSSFLNLGTAIVGAFGVRAASGALIGFNATMEDTRIGIAGMMALVKKTDLSSEVGRADRLFANLQRRAMTLPGTTMEYARMAGMITQPILDAGLGMKDLEDLTVSAVVGAKALGINWQVAARDIDQALRAQFHAVDVFTGKLLGSIGYKGEEGRARFNALSADKRAAELRKALTQKQIDQLATAQGATFTGVTSTLQDFGEQLAGKVGLPLFRKLTTEIKSWNKWLDENNRLLTQMATKVGDALVTGFTAIKDAVKFLVDNSGTIMAIGKVWLATQVGGLLGGAVKGGGMLTGAVTGAAEFMRRGRAPGDRFNPDTGAYEFDKGEKGGRGRERVTFGNVAGNLPLIGTAAALGFAFGNLLNDATGLSSKLAGLALDQTSTEFEKVRRQADALSDSLARAADANKKSAPAVTNLTGARMDLERQANLVRDFARAQESLMKNPGFRSFGTVADARSRMEAAGIDEGDFAKYGGAQGFADAMAKRAQQLVGQEVALGIAGNAAWAIGVRQLTDFQRQTLDSAKAQQDLLLYINQSLSKGIPISPKTVMELLRGATDDPQGKRKPLADKPRVNVTIQRIEVQSDDPDRMAFGLLESFRMAAKNPGAAIAAMREG